MNVKGILTELEIEIAHEARVNFNGPCPFHDDSSPSWSINKENGLWLCRAGCGSGNAVQFLQRVLGCTFEQAKAKLTEFSDPKLELSDLLKKKIARFESSSVYDYRPPMVSLPNSYELFREGELPKLDSPLSSGLQYLVKRMSFSAGLNFQIGVCTTGRYADRLIIPVMMFNQVVGFLARSLDPNSEKRYLNATNVLYSNLLFNYDTPLPEPKTVYLCESTFDCITMYEAGFPTMATFGARISYRQIELLIRKGVKKLVFCFHSDKAGDEGVKDKLGILMRVFSVYRLKIPENTDLNAMGPLLVKGLGIECLVPDKVSSILNSIQWKLEKS